MLPSTFREIHEGATTHFVRADRQKEVLRGPRDAEAEEYSRGRGVVKSYPLGAGGERMLVRQCRRGGLLGLIVRDLFWGQGRVIREIAASESAREQGIPTPLILAGRCDRIFGPFYRAAVVSVEIPNSCDLIRYFGAGRNRSAFPKKRKLIAAVARTIRKMHDAGVYHGDLHLKNILIDGAGAAYIVDLDRARLYPSLSLRRRMANLLRLDRSVCKWKAARESVTTVDRLRFLLGYAGDDEDMRRTCLRLFRQRRSYSLHRLFWKLMGIE